MQEKRRNNWTLIGSVGCAESLRNLGQEMGYE
jgi:hypothetical protein